MGIEEKLLAQLEENEEWIAVLEQSLAQLDCQLKDSHEKVQGLESMLHETRNSRCYKLAQRFACAARQIAPPGTGRRRMLLLGIRGLKAMPKFRNRQWVGQKFKTLSNQLGSTLGLLIRPEIFKRERLAVRLRYHRRLVLCPPLFPAFDQVDVSIIIPVFNHFPDTLACLESIAQFTRGRSFEVIVVDDASTDETPELARRIAGLVWLRNDQNLGFVGSCNRGAALARGDFLVFLNNDTVVTPGWLEALARTFRDMPDTGLAGAKLVYPDGRLQEAGSVIWRDASGHNYGKFDDAGHPRYNFTREVDYCSGACVMVPRALFQALGGFDTHFAPAYYEDTDLAFKIRHAGHKVIYQPMAKITHHEGLTSGRSLESGVKSYQRVNQTKFRERWNLRLDSHPPEPPHGADLNRYTRNLDLASRGHILVIDHRLPTPDRDGGSIRIMELIRGIRRRGHHVTFIPDNLIVSTPYLEDLQLIGVEVIHQAYYRSVLEYLKQNGRDFNLAIISRLDIAARHMTAVRRFAPQAKIVFDTVDLHFLRNEREAQLTQDQSLMSEAARRKQQELRLAVRADLTLVVSPIEKAILEKECPGIDVRVLPTIFPFEEIDTPGFDGRKDIIFIGGFQHPPNADAVLYFAREVFPRVRSRLPDVVFQVVGPDAPPEVLELASPCTQILGYVPDVRPFFDRARVSVAPIRFGAGVKGKVNQSMAFGVPTVVTSIAAEGMYLVHERDAMIADDPDSFADAVVRLWTSRELWESVSTHGRRSLREHFSVEAAAKPIDELLQWTGLPQPARSSPPNSSLVVSSHRAERKPANTGTVALSSEPLVGQFAS
jgi:GT2 family glycosyltransferase